MGVGIVVGAVEAAVNIGPALRTLVGTRDEAPDLKLTAAMVTNHSFRHIAYKHFVRAGNCQARSLSDQRLDHPVGFGIFFISDGLQ